MLKGPVHSYMLNRKASAKQAILVALETVEDAVRKARRAVESNEEVFVSSFSQALPALIESAAKYAVYLETLRLVEKD